MHNGNDDQLIPKILVTIKAVTIGWKNLAIKKIAPNNFTPAVSLTKKPFNSKMTQMKSDNKSSPNILILTTIDSNDIDTRLLLFDLI